MLNVGYPSAVLEMGEVQAAARALGIEVAPLEIRRAEDIAPAFDVHKAQADALYVVVDTLVSANRTRIITFALGARLPTIWNTRGFVQAGVSCPTDQISWIYSGALLDWSTRFYAA
jgi:putative ABC transport system substrate-binding protein